jgi:hypothetical protein
MRQPDDAQRGKRHRGRVLQVVPADRLCGEVADGDAAAAELGAVGIEDLDPPTRPREPDPMVVPATGVRLAMQGTLHQTGGNVRFPITGDAQPYVSGGVGDP